MGHRSMQGFNSPSLAPLITGSVHLATSAALAQLGCIRTPRVAAVCAAADFVCGGWRQLMAAARTPCHGDASERGGVRAALQSTPRW